MKIVLAFLMIALCYVSGEVTAEHKEKLHTMFKECQEKTSVTDEDIESLMQHKIPENQSGKCFVGCMKKKMGIMDADNKIDLARVAELMEHVKEKDSDKAEALTKVFETCAAEVPGGDDECEVAVKLMECCIREVEAAGIKINFAELYH